MATRTYARRLTEDEYKQLTSLFNSLTATVNALRQATEGTHLIEPLVADEIRRAKAHLESVRQVCCSEAPVEGYIQP